jgi:hypothetical protein
MKRPSLLRPLHLLGAIVILAPAATNAASPGRLAASPGRLGVARASHNSGVHLVAPRHERNSHAEHNNTDAETWMMLPVGLAAVGVALRRRQRAFDSPRPLAN